MKNGMLKDDRKGRGKGRMKKEITLTMCAV
jgi:hypothetical protein